jgi:hypothetical protein
MLSGDSQSAHMLPARAAGDATYASMGKILGRDAVLLLESLLFFVSAHSVSLQAQ